MECVILIGIPASGKSTFYRDRFTGTHVHISKDLMPKARKTSDRQSQLMAAAFTAGHSVVLDNTNASVAARAPIIAAARRHGATVAGYYFPTEVAGALRRNRARDGAARVPDVAIFTINKQLETPGWGEGFDELYRVQLDEQTRQFLVEPYSR